MVARERCGTSASKERLRNSSLLGTLRRRATATHFLFITSGLCFLLIRNSMNVALTVTLQIEGPMEFLGQGANVKSTVWYDPPPINIAEFNTTALGDGIRLNSNHNASMGTLDIISIGSLSRLDYQGAQEKVLLSHPAVRTLFRVTELDDADPYCQSNLTKKQAIQVTEYCRASDVRYPAMEPHRKDFINEWQLRRKGVGWLCAQKRSAAGLFKAVEHYKMDAFSSLPDYLVIIDDDTYIAVNNVLEHLTPTYPTERAFVVAGCRFRYGRFRAGKRYSFPFGGYGTIFSRGAVRNLVLPITCPSKQGFVKGVCAQLRKNMAGERAVFKRGMSLAEVIYQYVTSRPYHHVEQWNDAGFCFHSDWIYGYFVNYYAISEPEKDKAIQDFTMYDRRLIAYKGYEMKTVRRMPGFQKRLEGCNMTRYNCNRESHFCHYATPTWMEEFHRNRTTDRLEYS